MLGEYVFSIITSKLFKYIEDLPKDNQLVYRMLSVDETPFIDLGSRLFKVESQLYIRGEGEELIEGYDSPFNFYVRVGVYHEGTVDDIKKYYEASIRPSTNIVQLNGVTIVGDKVENVKKDEEIIRMVQGCITEEMILKGVGGFIKLNEKESEPNLTYRVDVVGSGIEDRPLGNAVVDTVVTLKKPIQDTKVMKVDRQILIKIPYYNHYNVKRFVKILEEYIKLICKKLPGYVRANDTVLVREYDDGVLHNQLGVFKNQEELDKIFSRIQQLEGVNVTGVTNSQIVCHDDKYKYLLGGNGFIIQLEDYNLVYIKGESSKEDTYNRLKDEKVLKMLNIYDYRTNVV